MALVQKTVGDGNSGTFSATFLADGSSNLTPAPTLYDSAAAEVLGLVTASPAANTIGDRLKTIHNDLSTTTATAAKQPALGTAGASSTDVLSVQGVAGGTPAPVSFASQAFDVQTAITRAANVTPYTANDVVGGAVDLGVMGPSGKAILITSANLLLNLTSAATLPTNMTSFRLYLYGVTPPSAIADNSPWLFPTSGISLSGDRASFLGFIDLGTPVNLGGTSNFTPYCEVNGLNKQVILSGTHLFGYLVTNGAYTPAANSEVYSLTLHAVSV